MKISKKIITNLKSGGLNFFLSVPCKLLANMITLLENDKEKYTIYYGEKINFITMKSYRTHFCSQLNIKNLDVIDSEKRSEYADVPHSTGLRP